MGRYRVKSVWSKSGYKCYEIQRRVSFTPIYITVDEWNRYAIGHKRAVEVMWLADCDKLIEKFERMDGMRSGCGIVK